VHRPAVDDLTDIEPVSKQMGERTHTEPNAATHLPITERLPSGANAAAVEILHQGSERAQFQITPEDQRTVSASSGTTMSFLLMLASKPILSVHKRSLVAGNSASGLLS
jgi:hypothetical protein